MAGIALLSGPQDPSQLDAVMNQLISQVNGYTQGQTALTDQVSAGSTTPSANAALGVITLGSSQAKNYKIPVPGVGQKLTLFATKSSTSGSAGQKVTLNTTASVTIGASYKTLIFKTKNQAVILEGISATEIGIISNVGTVLTS